MERPYKTTTRKVIEDLKEWENIFSHQKKRSKSKNGSKRYSQKSAAYKMGKNYHSLKCNLSTYRKAKRLNINMRNYLNKSFGVLRKKVKELESLPKE